jgi:hypothetical protein
VRELVVDGGVLLGGFLVEHDAAALLAQRLPRLQRLVLRRCPDLTDAHVAHAAARRLARQVVVVSDCGPGVSEAGVAAAAAAATTAAAAAAGRGRAGGHGRAAAAAARTGAAAGSSEGAAPARHAVSVVWADPAPGDYADATLGNTMDELLVSAAAT